MVIRTQLYRGAPALLVLAAASCTQLLGIDDAHIDPTLSQSPTTGGAAGSAGASSGAGGAGGSSAGHGGAGGAIASDASLDASDDGKPETSEAGSPICAQYCDDIMAFCDGNVKQYIDMPQCLKVCGLFVEGTVGGPDGNTAACRMKYAAKGRYAAGSEREAYCRKSGPGSDGTCGAICDSFCTLMMPTCTQARTPPYYYSTTDACLMTCRKLRDNPPYTVADGTLPDTNDAQCRLFHVTSAVMDPDEHCEHAMGITMCDAKTDAGDAGSD